MLPLDRRRALKHMVGDMEETNQARWKVRIEHPTAQPYEAVRTEPTIMQAAAAVLHEYALRTNRNLNDIDDFHVTRVRA